MADDFFSTTLLRASYEGVAFPVTDGASDGANALVEHMGYRRPGADLGFTGRDPYRGTLTIPLLNGLKGWGNLFPGTYFDLLSKFESTPIGQLAHPTKGLFTAGIKSWGEKLDPNVRSGVVLTVAWVEHNAQSSILLTAPGQAPANAPAAASTAAATADTAMAAVGTGYTPTSPVVLSALTALSLDSSWLAVRAAVNNMLAVVTGNLALPMFSTAAFTSTTCTPIHAAVAALEALRVTIYQVQATYLPGIAQVKTYTTPRPMSAGEVAVAVYGNLSLAGLVRASNPVSDFGQIPMGTVLTILPAP